MRLRKAEEAATIYIDDSAIRVLEVRGRKLRKWASIELEPGLVRDGVIQDQNAVAGKIRELWQSQGIDTKRVIAGISGINSLYRLITLPELPKDILPEAVEREAGRVLGVPLEQLYLSWQTLPSLRGEMLVYLAAFPRDSVDTLFSTLRRARLNPYLMDLTPLALARTATEPNVIMVNVHPAGFDLVILAGKIPQVVRSLSLARESLLEEKVPLITRELERAITFYNSTYKDKPLDLSVPLLVSGELAERTDVWGLLGGKNRSVRALTSPIKVPENFPTGQYLINIGLAMKELGKEATAYSLVNFNALPEVYRPKPRPISEILFRPILIAGIALIALGAFFNITTASHITDLRTELTDVKQMMASRGIQAKDITTLRGKISSFKDTTGALAYKLEELRSDREEINSDLREINKTPETIYLESISHKAGTLTVKGLAYDEEALFRYAENLRAGGRFSQVVITDMHQKEHQTDFTLTLTK